MNLSVLNNYDDVSLDAYKYLRALNIISRLKYWTQNSISKQEEDQIWYAMKEYRRATLEQNKRRKLQQHETPNR